MTDSFCASAVRGTQRLLVGALVFAFACSAALADGNPNDPYESFNRPMFAVNEVIDKYAAKPVAQAYDNVVPLPVKASVGNFLAMPEICGLASIARCRESLVMPGLTLGAC